MRTSDTDKKQHKFVAIDLVHMPVLLKNHPSTQTKFQSSSQPPMRSYMYRISKTSSKTKPGTIYGKSVDVLMLRKPLWSNVRQEKRTLFCMMLLVALIRKAFYQRTGKNFKNDSGPDIQIA